MVATDENRRAPRKSLFFFAHMTMLGHGGTVRVKIRNLSASGLMAESPVMPENGGHVAFDLRGIGWIEGTVAWVRGDRFGAAFAHPIDPDLARQPPGGAPGGEPAAQPDLLVIRPRGVALRPEEPDPRLLRRL